MPSMEYCKRCGVEASSNLKIDDRRVCTECYNDEIELHRTKGCEKAGDHFRKARAYARNGNVKQSIYQAEAGLNALKIFAASLPPSDNEKG